MSLLSELQALKEDRPMDFFDHVSKVTEAYCIEHNLPCKRQYTHDQLEDAFAAVRAVELGVFVPLAPAEACTDLGATDQPAPPQTHP